MQLPFKSAYQGCTMSSDLSGIFCNGGHAGYDKTIEGYGDAATQLIYYELSATSDNNNGGNDNGNDNGNAAGCDVFDIDGFLTECSLEFPSAKSEIDEVYGSMVGMIADLEAAQNATSDAVDVLSAKVESEISRVDGESDATNAAVSALETKMDDVVARLENEQSSTNDAVTAVDTKVDDEVQRVDGLIDGIKDTLDVMANLRTRQSAAGFGDYLQVDEANNVHVSKLFIALIIFWLVFAPIGMAWIAIKYFNGGKKAVNKYAKVEIMASESEDNALIVN